MSSGSLELQRSIYGVLSAGLPFALYDYVPQGSPVPYGHLGESTLVSDDTKSEEIEDHTLTIHTWSRHKGQSEIKQMQGQIRALLHRQVLVLTGFSAWPADVEFAQVFQDPDGETYHGVQRVRIRTQPNS